MASKLYRHSYSNRVYELVEDMGTNRVYLLSKEDSSIRQLSQSRLDRFFIPCTHIGSDKPKCNIPREVSWEHTQGFKHEKVKSDIVTLDFSNPKDTKTPKTPKPKVPDKSKRSRSSTGGGIITLKDICDNISMNPSQARRILRSKGMKAPSEGWQWNSKEESENIKKILKNS